MTRRLAILTGALVALACAAALAQAAFPPPSLTLDSGFSPPSGIARDDPVETKSASPKAVAVDGDRIYAVGESDSGAAGDTAILARRLNGTLDTDFSDDGKLTAPVSSSVEDSGVDIVVLPDRRLRILSTSGSGSTRDGAIIGLNPDGSRDVTFGAADGVADGIVTFQGAHSPLVPAAMALAPDGRLAVTGVSGQQLAGQPANDNTFVSMFNADGTPVATFGPDSTTGTVQLDRSGNATADAGTDVAFRPSGGVVVLGQVGSGSTADGLLHGFTDTGATDPTFSDDGDLVLAVGEAPTVPTALMAYQGNLWATGSTRTGSDTNAFIARVAADGSGLQSRQFDMRGQLIDASLAVTSVGSSLTVAPGTPTTLVVGGSVASATATDWAAAAFNGIEGDLAVAGFGDVAVSVPGNGGITGLAGSPNGWVAIAGPYQDTITTPTSQSTYTRIGQSRLFIDAEKTCDLVLTVVRPLEVVMAPHGAVPIEVRVANAGTRACGGSIDVPLPYALTSGGAATGPVPTGVLAPGASFTTTGLDLQHLGPIVRTGSVAVTVTAPADTDATDNAKTLNVRFRFCDLGVGAASRPAFVPNEGLRRFELLLRNTGTTACTKVRVAVSGDGRRSRAARYDVGAGRSVSDGVRAGLRHRAKPGTRVAMIFRAAVPGDPVTTNDSVRMSPRILAVGDTQASTPRGRARVVRGLARAGRGPAKAKQLRVTRVNVAIRRLGGGCRWLASERGRFRTRPAKASCRPLWLRAHGKRRWRLPTGGLPAGRYVLLTRATIGIGFREASFSKSDRNRVAFRVSD
jgi:hypothetical protein